MQPDKQPSGDQPIPEEPRGKTRTRRSQQEIYGDQPTRKSDRTPKPKRKHDDYVNSVFTALLPADQHPEETSKHFIVSFLPQSLRRHEIIDFTAMTLYDSLNATRI
ncbi:hypothetical protein HRG_010908 [Hirsutella rhossiliensis]